MQIHWRKMADDTTFTSCVDNSSAAPPDYLNFNEEKIAVRYRAGKQPGIFWLSGYRSDMLGMKANALDAWAKRKGLALTRHDYSGHGESSGKYHEGTISKWLGQSLAVFRRYIPAGHRQILVGSSMGAWIALRMVQELNKKEEKNASGEGTAAASGKPPIAALLLLAPAPDFTTELMEPQLSNDERERLKTEGFYVEKSEYFPDEPGNVWTREFFEDARENNRLLGGGMIETGGCPVHIIHGLKDTEVPVKLVDKLVQVLPPHLTERTQVVEGDHRLSRPEDVDYITASLERLVAKIGE